MARNARTVELLKAPDNAAVRYQDEVSVDWRFDAKGGEVYTFSAYVVLDGPPASYGVFSYQVDALANHPTTGVARDSVHIYLDATGNQIDAEKAREMPTYPLPTPAFTFVPKPTATMTPTAALPTVAPKPTATPTLEPAATPTVVLRDYPEP